MSTYMEIQIDVHMPEGRDSFTEEDDEKMEQLTELAEKLWPSRWTMSAGLTDGDAYEERMWTP